MICDTCKRETSVVSRVVVAKDYNRSLARALYNCPECFADKERRRQHAEPAAQLAPSGAGQESK